MKKTFLFILIGIFIFTSVAFFNGCSKKDDVIKIGAILPLSGDAAIYGKWAKQGLELAVNELNNNTNQKKKIKIIYEDDQCGPQAGVNSYHKLVNVDKVKVIIGALCSSSTMAIEPLANKDKVLLFSPGSSSPLLSNSGPYFFRNWPSDIYEGEFMAEFMYKDQGITNAAILYINNDYGLGLKNVFEEKYKSLGGEIILIEMFNQDDSSFREQLLKIKNRNVQGLYVPGHTKELGKIRKQMKELDIVIPFFSVVGFESPNTLEIAGNTAEGVFYTAPYFDTDSDIKNSQDFVSNYLKEYGEKPENFAAHAYDAVKILVQIINDVGIDTDKMIEALLELDYQGVSGPTEFKDNGDVIQPAMIKTVKDGKFVKYE